MVKLLMEFNWNNIRSYNNSQNNSFEELVCQLAREEDIQDKKSFYRIAAPDGGVEAFSILENGNEYGWQAKYFFSMNRSQWRQLDDSFKTALEKHPNLIKYYICLPIDRKDPKISKQKWFMDKWKLKVDEWEQYANNNDRKIEFEYWGSSELLHRLSLDKHSGRIEFWFNEKQFSSNYFNEKIQISIDDLGNRYTPDLNFNLEIAKAFDGLARDENFKSQFDDFYFNLIKKVKKVIKSMWRDHLKDSKKNLETYIIDLEDEYAKTNFYEMGKINYDLFIKICDKLNKEREALEKKINEIKEELSKKLDKKNSDKKDDYSNYEYQLRELISGINDFKEFLNSPIAILANKPILILSGKAGIGKSHLLADITKKRVERNQTSLLFLGQQFISDNHPWTQILSNILRLSIDENKFLQALEAKGQSDGSRVLIFIDAINEGRGRFFWKDNIRSFINMFEKFKWIGLVISIRTSYEKLIIPHDIIPMDKVVRIIHFGFRDVEYDAAKLFFNNYKIEQPSIPLLHPEFQNPLFLKIFCEGLENAGMSRIPEGYEGITEIIEFYIKSINKKLSEFNRLNYSESINLVLKSFKLLIKERSKIGFRYLKYEDIFPIIEKEFKKYSDKSRFLDELISEGIITKNLFWEKNDKYYEGVFISYERFEDHFLTSFLLEDNLDKNNPEKCFQKEGVFFEFIKDESTCSFNQGIIEALCIQIPELISKEFYEVAPHCKGYYQVMKAFVDSLIWRKTSTLSKKLKKYFNEHVLRYNDTNEKLLDTLLLISSNPNHLFNADFLHKTLIKLSLADRDAWWSIYLHKQYKYREPSKRIIDWALSDDERPYISDESIRLTAIILTWFFTTSNRYLRDQATKAMVALLKNKISILIQTLEDFKNVNDPYVLERLYAVAYGCSLRTKDLKSLMDLCKWIYDNLFSAKYVYPHVLIRDYARNIIEYALFLNLSIEVDTKRIRPPYKNKMPEDIPSNEDIKRYEFDYEAEDFKEYYWGQNSIIESMQPEHSELHMYGDFGRYVFQRAFRNWEELDPQELSNIVVECIFELGYDVEKHGKFDQFVNRHSYTGRSGRKAERIGKKYQWIAFHELLAIISDNFKMNDDSNWDGNNKIFFDGPWEPYIRDIDPTILIKNTKNEIYEQYSIHWWFKGININWDEENKDWLNQTSDLPNLSNIISVKDDENTEWLILDIHPNWIQPSKPDEIRWDQLRKNLWYRISSYLFLINDNINWIEWASEQNFYGGWMPDQARRYEIFSREYYWSPAYKFFQCPYHNGGTFREVNDRERKKTIGKLIMTNEIYFWENEYDCSKEDSIIFYKPSDFIFNKMKMRYNKKEGYLYNEKNELICFDPSIYTKSISCLLIRKLDFVDFLKDNNLGIFWTVTGEKLIVGGNINRDNYLGRLIINGFAHLSNEAGIVTELKPYVEEPPQRDCRKI
jgi:hypothetical protein